MFFVTVILVILGVVFLGWGLREHSREIMYLAVCFFMAAIGTGIIEFFAMSVLL